MAVRHTAQLPNRVAAHTVSPWGLQRCRRTSPSHSQTIIPISAVRNFHPPSSTLHGVRRMARGLQRRQILSSTTASGKESVHSGQCAVIGRRATNKRRRVEKRNMGDCAVCPQEGHTHRIYLSVVTVDFTKPPDTGLYAHFLSTKEVGGCNFCNRPSISVWVLRGAVTPLEARICYLCMIKLMKAVSATNRK